MKYAYSQLILDPETSGAFSFNVISGKCTGPYRFIAGFYGLIDMPAAFKKTKNCTLLGLKNTNTDDFIIFNRGSKDHQRFKNVYPCLKKKLDKDNIRINLPKCHVNKTEIEWLGCKFSQSGLSPLESKTSAILNPPAPKNIKQLRFFWGSVHYLGKFITYISQ